MRVFKPIFVVFLCACPSAPPGARLKNRQANEGAVSVRQAAFAYYAEHGTCPTLADVASDKRLVNTNDPWGHPYRIFCNSGEISVTSDGPDGIARTSDDISAK